MGIFDTIVDAASDYIRDNGDELIDTFRGYLSDGDDDSSGSGDGSGGDGGGGRDTFGGLLSSFLGDSEDGGRDGRGGAAEEGESGEDGWGGMFGRIVDRLSGDGGREELWDRADDLVDRFGSYLPDGARDVADQLLGRGGGDGGPGGAGGRGSSWIGSLLDGGESRVPNGWHAVANHPTVGHSFGELGFGGFVDHSLANLAGNYGGWPGGQNTLADVMAGRNGGPDPRVSMPADLIAGQNGGAYGAGVSSDPRVSMPTDLVRGRAVDIDGDGRPDRGVRPYRDVDGDGRPDGRVRSYRDVDGDGYPDRGVRPYRDVDGDGRADPDMRAYRDADGDGYPDRGVRGYREVDGDGRPDPGVRPYRDVDGAGRVDRPGYDDDYDDLVTSGAGPSQAHYQVLDDPTFPADPAPPPGPAGAADGPAVSGLAGVDAGGGAGPAVSGPAPVSVEQTPVEPPPSDFQQSIDAADQVDQQMGGMFDGLEGTA